MTIKQQGGIFGRNPTFNDVEANNLDVEALGIGVAANSTNILELSGAAPIMKVTAENGASGFRLNVSGAGSNTLRVQQDGASKLELNGNNLKINSGSLQLATAGQGIDFSATSGTGTSELFDDYEEGTWTPTYVASTTNPTFSSYGLQQGYYTKIGQMVYVSARLRTNGYNSDGAGNLRIGGLPFASASIATIGSGGAISILGSLSFTSNPATGYFISGGSYIQLNSNTLFTTATVSALDTGTANNDISFFGAYRAS